VSLDYEKRRDLLSRTVTMVRDFLMEEVYHDSDINQLANEWGMTPLHTRNLVSSEPPIMHDLLQIMSLTALDFGIVMRDPATGKEVTFFAAENLANEDEGSIQSEEVQFYNGSDKKGEDPLSDRDCGLSFLPKVHSRVILYDADGNEILPEAVEVDGSFDVDKEIGEDIVEAEFSEFTQRDIEEFESKCENCLDEQRLPDSTLCFNCDILGVDYDMPEDPERPEDYEPLELLASVDRKARTADFQTRRLLRAANLLKEETS
jgi:hypothetical protein